MKNLSAWLVFLAAFLGVIVSGAQVWIQTLDSKSQSNLESYKLKQEGYFRDYENKQEWELKAVEFMLENQDYFFSDKESERNRIRAVMISTFPRTIVDPILTKLDSIENHEEKLAILSKLVSECNDFKLPDTSYCPSEDLGVWDIETQSDCINNCENTGAQCCSYSAYSGHPNFPEVSNQCRASSDAMRQGCPGCTAGLTFASACKLIQSSKRE